MKQNIWIFNHYATNTFFESGGRHYNFAKYLLAKDYKPTIFCANTLHNTEKSIPLEGKIMCEDSNHGIPYVFIKASPYMGNGLSRVCNMVTFMMNLLKATKKHGSENGKPDVIIASSVHLLTCVAGIFIAKRYQVPCIIEIRDLWPESIVCYHGMSRKNPLILALYLLEKWIYTKADRLIFTMEGGKDYITERGWDKAHGGSVDLDKVYHINNGVDLEEFDYNKEHFTIDDEDLNDPDTFKVVYTGSIREVNDLQLLVDAAVLLQDKPQIKFLVYGDGTERVKLQEYCKVNEISNVSFKGRVEKKYIPYITSKASINIIIVRQTAIMRFGCSLNKLFEYLASGRPILSNLKTAYCLIDRYNCGVVTEKSNAEAVKDNILQLDDTDRRMLTQLGENARSTACQYDFRVLTDKLQRIIDEVV